MEATMNELRGLGVATLYALGAICGLVGGCAAGFYYTKHSLRLPLVLAYGFVGMVSAIVFYAVSAITGYFYPDTIHKHILYCVVAGSVVSTALFAANATVKIIFQKLGVEVQITTRKEGEERRNRRRSTSTSTNSSQPTDGDNNDG